MIKLIWAQTADGVIGDKNGLPWNLPEEMAHFRQTTLNQNVLMGRNTFASMGDKPLKNRFNYVLTQKITPEEALISHNPLKKLVFIDNITPEVKRFSQSKTNDLYVIGGNQVFKTFFPYADEIIRTIINHPYQGDLKITPFDEDQFRLVKTITKPDFKIEYLERIMSHGQQ